MKLQELCVYNPWQVQQLKKLVAQGEGASLEFKRKVTNPEKVIREMVAFANTSGGVLLVGIGDDRSIPGLKFPEDERHVIMEQLT
jgi:predicted HTH transcriptional regulator